MSVSPTRELAKFVVETRYEDIPRETIDGPLGIKAHILNALGVGLLGSTRRHGPTQLLELLKRWGGREEATVWGYNLKLPAVNAAMANAMAVKALNYDDGDGHPGGPAVSTAIAVAEREGKVDGRELLAAVTIGYEVAGRISRTVSSVFVAGKSPITMGKYCSGTYNHFGAMAVAGKLVGLSVDEMVQCFGIGGCEAYGLYSPTMVRWLHHSRAARAGIMAADLAKIGFTGAPYQFKPEYRVGILEKEWGGFLQCFTAETYRDLDLNWLTKGLGREFFCTDAPIYFNVTGSMYTPHLLKELVAKHPIKVDQIDKIIIEMSPARIAMHEGPEWRSSTTTVSDINAALQHEGYCASVLLLEGECTQRQFTEEKIRDPKILELAGKVELKSWRPEIEKLGPAAYAATIVHKDGTKYTATSPPIKPLGTKDNPPSRELLHNKFRDCATDVDCIDMERANKIIDTVEGLEELKDVSELVKLLIPERIR